VEGPSFKKDLPPKLYFHKKHSPSLVSSRP
jgi:hypothetical protein